DLTRTLFKQIMALFTEGVFHPLPFHTFEADDIVNAFRYMQQSRQIGKIVVTYNNGITATQTSDTTAQGSLTLPADATFLITGGLSGFGLKTAQWLVQKGVRNLVLVSRSGPVSDEAHNAITSLQQSGVTVHAAACDVTSKEALSELLAEIAKTLPPLRGIVHAAMVIHDGLIQTMGREQIHQVFAPKILGAAYLHELTLQLPLEYFILFSSATTLFGNPGQGNYVAANYWLEAFAACRESAGLPVTCVSWSPISDTGYLARNQQVKDALQNRLGGEALSTATALDLLEKLLLGKHSGLGVLDLDWKTLSRSLPSADSPKFMELSRQVGISNEHQEQKPDIRQLLQQLPEAELLSTFIELLKQEVGTVLRIDPAKIDQDRVLSDMGLDSLMGVELAVALESLCGVKVPVMVLTDSPTITKLASYLLTQLFSAQGAQDSNNGHDLLDQVQQVLYQHGADLADDMVEELVAQVHDAAASDDKRMIQ
ncbi:MAG: SDR family NAD(P)-dependent oxidoreductase, partial [Trichlorobacter sp.]|uniref:beta-ketoacyl reductase n=1 Tax=Trichlorobacter sp. TaxID=2911007 RepID=UPI00256A19C2